MILTPLRCNDNMMNFSIEIIQEIEIVIDDNDTFVLIRYQGSWLFPFFFSVSLENEIRDSGFIWKREVEIW